MTTNKSAYGRAVLAAAVILILAGCAAQTQAPAVSAKAKAAPAVLIPEYKMPAGRVLTYQGTSEESQVLDVMGQTMDTRTTGSSTFTFKAKGMKEKDFLLGVTIDEIVLTVGSSMQGDMSPDMSSVKGKSFDMVLSPLGSEVDVSGAEALTYSIQGETRDLANSFKLFFPDLPGKPLKIGETWPTSAAIEEKTGSMTIQIQLELVHTVEAFETVEGMECARIASDINGTIAGSGSQMGQDMSFAGTTKGKDIWYFAVKEGLYVKTTSESTSEVSIDVPAAGMSIPMTMTSKGEIKLTGKG